MDSKTSSIDNSLNIVEKIATAYNHASRSEPSKSSNSRTSLIESTSPSKPLGVSLFGKCYSFNSQQNKRAFHKALVLVLTFIAYTAFHMGRRPLSIVKSVLHQNHSHPLAGLASTAGGAIARQVAVASTEAPHHAIVAPSPYFIALNLSGATLSSAAYAPQQPAIRDDGSLAATPRDVPSDSAGWAPFDDNETGLRLLAVLDTSFLSAYALFMFFSGFVAERMNLRYVISFGSTLSGLGLIAFGLARWLDLHSMIYFIAIQVFSGAVQSTGWPVVVTCVSNWFEPGKRGLIFGLWNSHTNLGNILGAVIAGVFVERDWCLSFVVPGALMILVGLILFLFLVPMPRDVDLSASSEDDSEFCMPPPSQQRQLADDQPACGARPPAAKQVVSTVSGYQMFDADLEREAAPSRSGSQAASSQATDHIKAVSFCTALKIPGVIEYSFCLFFSKLVSYTFLYWLPLYIAASTKHDSEESAYMSTYFDVGGAFGAILAGYLSDKFNANGLTCGVMLIAAMPSMFIYQKIGSNSSLNNMLLQAILGALVNGPYCLITTSVSADLGGRITDGRAMATVAAIIDGMGSIGAVVGPLFAGFVAGSGDWQAVFIMLMLANALASLCLLRILIREAKEKFFRRSQRDESQQTGELDL